MKTKAMLYTIQIATVLGILFSTAAQRWPKSGSCSPCHCSAQESKYTYGLVKYVNCSTLGLVTVPSNLPKDLVFLDLSYNNIDISNIKKICDFESLQFLSLAYNFFTSISDSPFSKCSLLVNLDLTGNIIVHLRNDSFKGLDNMQTIYGLEAESVEDGVFEKMHKLKTLEFFFLGNSIPGRIFTGLPVETLNITLSMAVKIPKGIFEFGEKTLQFLSLSGPKVTFIYENLFRGLTVLRKVHIHMPKLESLPERLFNNFGVPRNGEGDPRNLQEIILTSMNTIPDTIFQDLESLQRLEIHEVHEIAISRLFDDLVNLEVLDLTNSSVVQIPPEWFSKLYSLKTLNLSNCNLRIIEDRSLIGLMNLKTLDLSMNALRNIPLKTFDPLRNSIQNLHLRGNILKVIDNHLFRKMLALQYLDLSDNKIANITENAFADLKLLNSLQLQENKLTFLPLNLFLQQPNLQILYLGTNSFRRIPLSVMKSPGFLLKLYLPNNRIFSIPKTLPSELPYLEYLSLMENSLQCRCRLLSVRLYKPNLYIDGVCAAPWEFRGRHIMSFEVPDKCDGPRQKLVTKTDIPKVIPPSTVPPYLSSGQGDYYSDYYYYYGSEDYNYETDHYYDQRTQEKIPYTVSTRGFSMSRENNRTVDINTSLSVGMLFTQFPGGSIQTNESYQVQNATYLPVNSTDLFASTDIPYTTSPLLTTEPLSRHVNVTKGTKASSIVTKSVDVELQSTEQISSLELTSDIKHSGSTTVPGHESLKPFSNSQISGSRFTEHTKSHAADRNTSICVWLFTSPDISVTEESRSFTETSGSDQTKLTSTTDYMNTSYSIDETGRSVDSSSYDSATISPTGTVDISDVSTVLEKPHGTKMEVGTSGMSTEVKGIVGFLGVGAFICICGTLWWLKNQIAKRRVYEVTPPSTVV